MTDLEKIWDDMSAGEPPVDAILRSGRAEAAARRRRLVTRPLIAFGATAALLATFVAGTHVGGPSAPGRPPGLDARPAAFQADLDPAASCKELLASYRERGLALVTAYGWEQAYREPHVLEGDLARLDGVTAGGALFRSSSKAGYAARQRVASATGTNVQETGVDEPDSVKTDGSRIVRLREDDLIVYDATGPTPRKVSTLHLPHLSDGEILLDGDTVMAIGADSTSPPDLLTGQRGTRTITVSLEKPDRPVITSDVAYSAPVDAVRQHGSVARLVLASGLPDLDLVRPSSTVDQQEALRANRAAVRKSTITDWLPTYDTGDGTKQLVDCRNVAIPSEEIGLGTVTVVGVDLEKPTDPHTIGLAGDTSIAYESKDHLFLAANGRTDGTAHVFDFELAGVDATHVASGEVEGTIKDRWSMDEADDVLRVAVGPTSETGRFNSILTLRRTGTALDEIGRIDHLGKDEQIKGVRWFDHLAIVVTFRQVDPLYTVDLTTPSRPKLLGTLKIPGYSDYLHPLGTRQLLGIGYVRGKAQIALFDVADYADVTQDDVVTFPRTQALATRDPRSFTWLPDHQVVLTVLKKGNTAYLATISVGDGTLRSTRQQVEYGSDSSAVRTIELADGRVVLVTGEDVTFLDLPPAGR